MKPGNDVVIGKGEVRPSALPPSAEIRRPRLGDAIAVDHEGAAAEDPVRQHQIGARQQNHLGPD